MFKAGFARVDVTPPFGTKITGYFAERIADGILDPLELNALAVNFNEQTFVVIAADMLEIFIEDATEIRTAIAEATALPLDNIIIQALHQHTSTNPGRRKGVVGLEYQIFLTKCYCDVALAAIDDLKEATVSVAEEETKTPISFVRRYRMKDGSAKTNPPYRDPNILEPIGTADNTVRFVKFERENAKDIALVGFQTHPDNIGGNKFSADWPGAARRSTEKALDVNCILINGCEGDCATANYPNADPRETFEERYGYVRFMGQSIADVVSKNWTNTKPVKIDRIFGDCQLTYVPGVTEGFERIEECKELFEIISLPEYREKYTMEEKAVIRRIAGLDTTSIAHKIPVSVLTFGNISILGYAGEAFAEYAYEMRREFPDRFILTAINANGAQGYFPTAEAYKEGGYEASASNFRPVVKDILQGAAKELLKK